MVYIHTSYELVPISIKQSDAACANALDISRQLHEVLQKQCKIFATAAAAACAVFLAALRLSTCCALLSLFFGGLSICFDTGEPTVLRLYPLAVSLKGARSGNADRQVSLEIDER